MNLFQLGSFQMHSGATGEWKIEADALTEGDWETLAFVIAQRVKFSQVYGVPTGGERLADALRLYEKPEGSILIVDDVLTTGASMEEAKQRFEGEHVIGVVVFARGKPPWWVKAVFQLW